jgi:hypothetical protein
MSAVALCLLAGAVVVPLGGDEATLVWRHSVEKIPWEEDWRATAAGLVVVAARVRGSGAGMEAGEGARLVDGAWTWRPTLPPQARVVLARSGATADWRICVAGRCRAIDAIVPAEVERVTLTTCDVDPARGTASVRDADGTAR